MAFARAACDVDWPGHERELSSLQAPTDALFVDYPDLEILTPDVPVTTVGLNWIMCKGQSVQAGCAEKGWIAV